MNIVNKLTLRHLRLNRGRTVITVLGIVISIAMVCCVAGFILSLHDLGIQEIKESKGDWHVAYIDVTQETAELIAGEGIFSSYYTEDGDTEGMTNIYLRLEHPKRDVIEVAGGIAEKYGVEVWGGNTELLALEGVIPYDNVMNTFLIIAAIAIAIIVAGSVIVISNAFYISASERVRQFGLLKSAGATSGQIRRSILFEALVLTAIAIPIGIALGFLIQAAMLWLTNNLLVDLFKINDFSIAFRVIFSPVIIYISIAIAVLTVFISAWLPARRASKISPIDAIRQTKDIKIRSKQLKTSRMTRALFGFEGTLAAKSLKRSRGKYRATVVSLTVSIVLFISMSSFVWVLNKSADMGLGGYDFDVLIYMRGDLDTVDEAGELIRSIPDADVRRCQRTSLATALPDGFYTKQAAENGYANPNPQLLLYSMPDAEFDKIVPPGEGDGMRGILINTTGSLRNDGKIKELSPYNCVPGTKLRLGIGDTDAEPRMIGAVTVAAVSDKIPNWIPGALFAGESVNIFVAETEYREFILAYEKDLTDWTETQYAVTTKNPDAFCEAVYAQSEGYRERDDIRINVNNVAQITRLNRNLTMAIMLFGYGFIAMLSLIAVTSVIATISTNMALRKQEFAMLYSTGMTSEGMNKMLNLESLLYGLKSLLIGLPVGLALSYLIYWAMTGTAEFAYEFPFRTMAISAAVVMLLTFGTMRYGKKKLNKISIVEAIRSEVV